MWYNHLIHVVQPSNDIRLIRNNYIIRETPDYYHAYHLKYEFFISSTQI